MLQTMIGALCGVGLYFVLADVYRIPYLKTSKAVESLSKKQKVKTSTLNVWLGNLADFLAKHLKLNEFKKAQLEADLKTAQMDITPEKFKANAIVKALLIGIFAIPMAFIFPMGFAQSLPVTSGMSSWQNDTRNLNPVLSKLGIGGISNLKNGDKVLVEPLYDVRLESVWHSLTVTEIALYGKHILGANSDGGASKTSESWGFIAKYTNRHFPNALYTPDGQGLWTGAEKLTSQATFYTIINSGYGVGIAYTETKPDFTPNLSVYCCEAWPGDLSVRNKNHYGISYGNSFANWTYGNGYPKTDSSIWYAVHFPAETENCYVKQSVWVVGGGSTSRNVWSNSNTWYDVKLNPTTVGNGTSYITVKARADWIESNGTVKKYGAEKTLTCISVYRKHMKKTSQPTITLITWKW